MNNDISSPKDILYFFIHSSLFIISFNFLALNFTGLMPELSRLIGISLLILWSGFFFTKKNYDKNNYLKLALFPVSFFFIISNTTWILGTGLFVFSITGFNNKNSFEHEIEICLLTIILYTVLFSFYKYSPYIWYFVNWSSLIFSTNISSFFDNKMTLSASALGFSINLSVFCFLLSTFIFIRKIYYIIYIFLTILIINVCYIWLYKPIIYLLAILNIKNVNIFQLHIFLLVFLLLSIIPIINKLSTNTNNSSSDIKKIIISSLIIFIGFSVLSIHIKGKLNPKEVIFCDKNANFRVPYFSKKYGEASVGMFGILPNYLIMKGIKTRIIKENITEEILKNAGVIVVFNPGIKFLQKEKEIIYEFLKNGGSLLVAGDHTDVTGIMEPINDLIKPTGIKLNFDTALPFNSGWDYSLEKRKHPILNNIINDYDTSIWVGASLDINFPASPLIIGKYGWADNGNYLNTKRAYLGDYVRSSNEQLGDIVLAAQSSLGKGKVLVFGDSSTFQNGVLCNSYFFLDNIFNWLLSDIDFYYPFQQLIISIIVLSLLLVILKNNISSFALVCLIISANYAIIFTNYTESKINNQKFNFNNKYSFYKPAHIDISHIGRFSLFSSDDLGSWGLAMNIMRNAYLPLYLRDFNEQELMQSKLYFVISPTIEYSSYEIEILKKYMKNGSTIIWSVGWEEIEASRSFLNEFKIDIDSIPLGPAEVIYNNLQVKFVESWPIIMDSKNTKALLKMDNFNMIAYYPYGKGGLIVIGDSEFFLNKNIESYESYNIYNILYIKTLIDMIKAKN